MMSASGSAARTAGNSESSAIRNRMVLGLVAERARHAAAARSDHLNLEIWHQAEAAGHRVHGTKRLLVAVTVHQRLPPPFARSGRLQSPGLVLAPQELLEQQRLAVPAAVASPGTSAVNSSRMVSRHDGSGRRPARLPRRTGRARRASRAPRVWPPRPARPQGRCARSRAAAARLAAPHAPGSRRPRAPRPRPWRCPARTRW